MQEFFLDSIPFIPDFEALAKRLHIRAGSPFMADLQGFVSEMQATARPKVFYKIAFIDKTDTDTLVIDGVTFHSRILCVNLAEVDRVFVYLATCGTELADRREQEQDILFQFWADAIMETAVRAAVEALQADLTARFQTGKTSVMNPGSLKDWPITEQKPFFQLLGPGALQTGVVLNDSMLMHPAKSITGLYFETESGFVSCQLCPRQTCPNRRSDYIPGLLDQKYPGKLVLTQNFGLSNASGRAPREKVGLKIATNPMTVICTRR